MHDNLTLHNMFNMVQAQNLSKVHWWWFNCVLRDVRAGVTWLTRNQRGSPGWEDWLYHWRRTAAVLPLSSSPALARISCGSSLPTAGPQSTTPECLQCRCETSPSPAERSYSPHLTQRDWWDARATGGVTIQESWWVCITCIKLIDWFGVWVTRCSNEAGKYLLYDPVNENMHHKYKHTCTYAMHVEFVLTRVYFWFHWVTLSALV